MLAVAELRKAYGDVVALRGVDLHVPAGQITALLGPNGAGKTTLVSIVAGLRSADAGTVHVDGIDALSRTVEARRRIGLAPQDLGIYPIVTVRDNLVLFGELAGLRRAVLGERIDEVAAALDISDLLDRIAGTLSGGQKRRLHTAIALLHQPRLLLLDEATVGADIETRHHLLALVRRMANDGAAILYSTHYLHEVDELNAEVAIIDDGRVIAEGRPADLIARHASPFIEVAFDGVAPPPPDGLHGTRDGEVLRIATDGQDDPMRRVLQSLGDHTRRVRAVEVTGASLEGVYLALTGKAYEPTGPTTAAPDPAPATTGGDA